MKSSIEAGLAVLEVLHGVANLVLDGNKEKTAIRACSCGFAPRKSQMGLLRNSMLDMLKEALRHQAYKVCACPLSTLRSTTQHQTFLVIATALQFARCTAGLNVTVVRRQYGIYGVDRP